jgi:hypothetical protein
LNTEPVLLVCWQSAPRKSHFNAREAPYEQRNISFDNSER